MNEKDDQEGRRIMSHRHQRIGEGDPYDVMSSIGVDPSSRAIDVHRAGMNAQRSASDRRAEYNKAWAELRSNERRLCLDLGFVHIPTGEGSDEDPAIRGREPEAELEPPPLPTLPTLVHALGPPPGHACGSGVAELAMPTVQVDTWALAQELLEPSELPERPLAEVGSLLEEL